MNFEEKERWGVALGGAVWTVEVLMFPGGN
jgi:hypothetical protein